MSAPFSFPLSSSFGSGFTFTPGGVSLSSLDPTSIGGLFDQLIDPNTLDYVRNDIGEWAETADTRTAMLLMLEIEHAASPFDPADGTVFKQRRRAGDPITADDVRAETLRAAGVLQAAGLISDLEVDVRGSDGQLFRDLAGRLVVRVAWRDLASGSPVDIAFQPG